MYFLQYLINDTYTNDKKKNQLSTWKNTRWFLKHRNSLCIVCIKNVHIVETRRKIEILTLLTSGGMFPLCVSFRYLSVLKIKRCPDQASFQSPRQRRIRVTPRDLSVLLPLVLLHSIFHHFPIVHFPLVSSISIRLQWRLYFRERTRGLYGAELRGWSWSSGCQGWGVRKDAGETGRKRKRRR